MLGSSGSLPWLERRLTRVGVRVRRVPIIEQVPVATPPPLPPPRPGRRSLLLVTSAATVDLYLRSSRPALRAWRRRGEVWAVGAATAQRVRSCGISRVRTAPVPGSADVVREIGSVRGAWIVRPRSDLAGRGLALELRRRGAEVVDLVVYRTRGVRARASTLPLHDRQVWLLTSPSALGAWRSSVGERNFQGLRRQRKVVAMGPTTARAARGHGLRGVLVPPDLSEQSLPAFLVTLLADAR